MGNPYIKPTNSNVEEALKQKYRERDDVYFRCIEGFLERKELSLEDMIKNYPSFIRRRDLPRLLAHYELFKLVKNIPGSIIELGVHFGAGLFTFHKLLETFCPGDRTRKVYGFDTFDGYENFSAADGDAKEWISHVGSKDSDTGVMNALSFINNLDNMIPGVERCVLIPGDIIETVPAFAEQPDGLRISLLYFDSNLYEPTRIGLEHLYPLVVPGGIVAFNAYGIPPWEGETRAVDEFLVAKKIKMQKFEFTNIPSMYFVKP